MSFIHSFIVIAVVTYPLALLLWWVGLGNGCCWEVLWSVIGFWLSWWLLAWMRSVMAFRAFRAMRAVKARLGWAGMSLVINFIRWGLANGCRWF